MEIVDAIKKHMVNGTYPSVNLYGDGQAGRRIAKLLATAPLKVDKRLTY